MNRRQLVVAAVAVALIGVIVLATRPASEGLVPLRIGEDTTRIVGPLDANGLPDYLAVLNDVEVPAPADNAAIPLLRVLGTDVLLGDVTAILAAIGAPPDLPAVGSLVPPDPEADYHPIDDPPADPEQIAIRDAWIAANETARAHFAKAAERPRLWLPRVRVSRPDPSVENTLATAFDLLPTGTVLVIESALPTMNGIGALFDLLDVRAAAALERGDHVGALAEADLFFALGPLVAQAPGLIDRLISVGAHHRGLQVLQSIVQSPGAGEVVLLQVRDTARSLQPAAGLHDVFDVRERYYVLDMVSSNALGADPNALMRAFNRRLDEALVHLRVLDQGTVQALLTASDELNAHVRTLGVPSDDPLGALRANVGPAARRELDSEVGEILAASVVDIMAFSAKCIAQLARRRRNVLVATWLRLHALEQGAYPRALEELEPVIRPALIHHPMLPAEIPYELTPTGCRIDEGEDWAIELPAP